MRPSRLRHTLQFAVLLPLCLGIAQQSGPASLDRVSEQQRLYVLDDSGRILVSEPSQIDVPTRILAQVPSNIKALDIVSTKIWGKRELAFITGYGLTPSDSRSRLIQYSVIGEEECEWLLPEIAAGLDIDPDEHIIYLAGSSTATVYGLKLLKDTCYGPNQLKPIIQLKGASRLGPLVLDSKNHRAFVGDILKGSIYEIDLQRGWSLDVVHSLGQPVALLYDEGNDQLYAADGAGQRIWRIRVSNLPTPTPDVIFRGSISEELSSLAFGSDGKLLVGDRRGNVILTLSLSGQIVKRSPMP